MFPRDERGYAVVDDAVFGADDRREDLAWALDIADSRPNPGADSDVDWDWDDFEVSAFGLLDHMRNHTDVEDDDLWDEYFSRDDDVLRGTFGLGRPETTRERRSEYDRDDEEFEDDDDDEERPVCSIPAWYYRYNPTCNELHATTSGPQWLLGEDVYTRRWEKRRRRAAAAGGSHLSAYLGHGYFRDAFLLFLAAPREDGEGPHGAREDKLVFKTMRHLFAGSKLAVADDDVIADKKWGRDPLDRYVNKAKSYSCGLIFPQTVSTC